MIRILNFFCFAFVALSCLALYQVSEKTRLAEVSLNETNHAIAAQHSAMSVLEAEWGRVAAPARIQRLAETRLGLSDAPAVELSSLELLPRRGESAPLGNSNVRNASATAPEPRDPRIRLAAIHTGN